MKSLKNMIFFTLIATMVQALNASTGGFTTTAGSKIAVYNQSNVPVTLNWVGNKGTITSGAIPAATVSGSVTTPGTGSIVYKADTYTSVNVVYTVSPADAATLSFAPTTLPTAVYIYGNGTVSMSSLDTTTSASNPFPSRYIAWWTGNINVATSSNTTGLATAAAAVADKATNALVSLYMASVDGKYSLVTF